MSLSKLPGNTLKGTFHDAYHLLTLITSKIGWDELLKFRSNAFVMEEEYKIQIMTNVDERPRPYTGKRITIQLIKNGYLCTRTK